MSAIDFGGNALGYANQVQDDLTISGFDIPVESLYGFMVVGFVVTMLYLKNSANIGNPCHLGKRLCQRTIAGVMGCQDQLVNLFKCGRVAQNQADAEQVRSSSTSTNAVHPQKSSIQQDLQQEPGYVMVERPETQKEVA